MSARHIYVVLLIASLSILQFIDGQSEDEFEYQRLARAPKPKFIRFGRGGGAKFIRFGRSVSNAWDDPVSEGSDLLTEVKRGAKFIRFG